MVVHKIEAKKPQQGTGIPVKRLLKVAAYENTFMGVLL